MKREKLQREAGNWVSGEKFWNREVEVQSFLEHLAEGANLLLTAPRRTGKTSLLREVERIINEESSEIALYVDLERAHSPADAIVEISLKTRPIGSLWSRTKGVFHNLGDKIDEIKIDELALKLKDSAIANWKGKGDRLLESLATADRPVALFLDEFPILIHRLLERDDDHRITVKGRAEADAFLSWVRAASSAYPGKIRFVLAGSIGLAPLLQQAGLSATVNNFSVFRLDPWSKSVAEECIHALARHYELTLEDGASARMTELLGLCVPHHVQTFFSHVYEDCKLRWPKASARNTVAVVDVERVYRERLLGARGHTDLSHFEERLRLVLGPSLLPLVIDLLNEATHGPLSAEAARALTEEHLPDRPGRTSRLQEILDTLEHDGYLERTEGGFRFASNLVADWWRARFGFGFTPIAKREGPR